MFRILKILTWTSGFVAVGLAGFYATLWLNQEPDISPPPRETAYHFSFKSAKIDRTILKAGWASPEKWGVWSNGPKAALLLPIDTTKSKLIALTLTSQAFLAKSHERQSVDVLLNDRRIDTLQFNLGKRSGSFKINIKGDNIPKGDQFRLSFLIRDPKSPQQLGQGTDNRALGIGLIDLEIKLYDIQNVFVQSD